MSFPAKKPVRLFLAILSLSLIVACGEGTISEAAAPLPSPFLTAPTPIPTDLVLEVGGSFGDSPSMPGGPMTQKQAREEAVLRGQAITSKTDVVPLTEIELLPYSEYVRTLEGTVAAQLPANNTVYLVHVLSPFPAEALPRPYGAKEPESWPSYYVAFDPRTGLALSVTPGE